MARRGDQVADALATMLDIPAESVEVELLPELTAAVRGARSTALEASAKAAKASEEASRAMRNAVTTPRAQENLGVRDTAVLLGVSH